MNTQWYEEESWYEPLSAPQSEAPAPESPASAPEITPQEKKKRTRFRVIGGLCLALLLILVSSWALRDRSDANATPSSGQESGPVEKPGFRIEPSIPNIPSDSEDDGGFPDTFKEFFDSYYTREDSSTVVVNIPRVQTPLDYSLALKDAPAKALSLSELYARCMPSVVGISAYTNGSAGYSWGSGVILSSDGLIITNTHVLENADSAIVTLYDDSQYEALLVGADTISDIALLKIEATGLPAAAFGDSSQLSVGDPVAAIGNPLGEEFRMTMTNGIISAIDRGVTHNGRSMTLLQTNTALNEGNSGGPLFNQYGQVIGITNMKMMSSYSSIEGIGFAIPSVTARNVVNALVQDGEVRGRTSIGITVGAIAEQTAEQYDLPVGLYISDVVEGSDAANKGVRPGDILLAINGEAVSTTADVLRIKDSFKVGDTLRFTLWRDGETFELDVALMDTNDVYK